MSVLSSSSTSPCQWLTLFTALVIKRRRIATQPSRTSPRLREIQDANQQRAENIRKPARSSLRTTRTHHRIGTEQPEPSLTNPKAQKNCWLSHLLVITSTTNTKVVKRHRNIEDGALSNHKAKRSKRDNVGESKLGINQSKDEFIKAWLSSTDDEKTSGELDLMPAG